MSEGRIGLAREGSIARLTIDNPERRNAVSLEMWEAMERALAELEADAAVRVLVIAGAGGKAFASGADISRFERERSTPEQTEHYNAVTARLFARLEAFPRPTIAQIDGACVGGGLALAVCCDLRFCGTRSVFAIPAARLGLGYGFESVQRLVRVIGPASAKEMLFTARRFTAPEALAMRLVNRVVEDEAVMGITTETAGLIAANAPLTVAAAKATIGEVVKDPAERDLAHSERLVHACFTSLDYVEGRRAFLEKREPRFTGS